VKCSNLQQLMQYRGWCKEGVVSTDKGFGVRVTNAKPYSFYHDKSALVTGGTGAFGNRSIRTYWSGLKRTLYLTRLAQRRAAWAEELEEEPMQRHALTVARTR
jgi:hypothetical protein